MAVSSVRPVIPFPFGTTSQNVSTEPLTTAVDRAALKTSSKILDIIGRYRMKQDDNIYSHSDESTLKFIALIYTHVKAGKPVPMCLPAFPFKSPNSTSKTLGKLPDKGEEIALAHLNGLCSAIGDVYTPGARLTIISDGLVYNGEKTFLTCKTRAKHSRPSWCPR